MPTTIHLIRHAEGFHNLAQDSSISDPYLTPRGLAQSRELGANFPNKGKITHIVASPMKRTLHTAYHAFQDLIDGPSGNKKIIAQPLLQECSERECDVGSEPEVLQLEFSAFADLTLVVKGWNDKSPVYSRYAADDDALELRARDARVWLRELGRSREDAVIVVVSHGDFIPLLTTKIMYWQNVECHTYEFINPDANDGNAFIHELVAAAKA